MRYHIWLLNAAESLFSPLANRKRVERILSSVVWETRSVGDRITQNLMPDEEYFVPIAIKCLGNQWENHSLSPEGRSILKEIEYLYFRQWKLPPWQSFWDQSSPFRSMKTPPGVGYFQIIQQNHRIGDKHILIGYSQGGVVARFLAFLDEYVFQTHMIDAVITIASPLKGSPLASPTNKETITDALIKIILEFFSFYEYYDGKTGFVRVLKRLRLIKFQDIDNLLSDWIADSRDLASLHPYYATIGNYLSTFQKWLSGLHGDRESAFWELNPSRILSPFSVLSLIQKPLLAKRATIVTQNHSVEEIAKDYFALSLGSWIYPFWKWARPWLLSRKFGGQTLASNLNAIQTTYDTELIGCFPPYHHDFMVPSNLQSIDEETSLGIYPLPRANHLNGKNPSSPGGRAILQALYSILQDYQKCQK